MPDVEVTCNVSTCFIIIQSLPNEMSSDFALIVTIGLDRREVVIGMGLTRNRVECVQWIHVMETVDGLL